MKKLLFALLLFASPAFGQIAKGNITATGSDCTTTNACVQMVLPANSGGVSITLSGTFTATATFEVIGGSGLQSDKQTVTAFPTNSTTGVTTASAPGTWTASVGGMTIVQVRCSAFTSGTIVVTIQATPALTAAILAGAGGGGGGCSPSASAGQVLYSPAGTDCAGVPGFTSDANGDLNLSVATSSGSTPVFTINAPADGSEVDVLKSSNSASEEIMHMEETGAWYQTARYKGGAQAGTSNALNLQSLYEGTADSTGFQIALVASASGEFTGNNGNIIGAQVFAVGDDGGGTSITSTGLQIGQVSGATTGSNFGMTVADLPASGDYAIKTGTGKVSFGDKVTAPSLSTGGTSNTDLAGSVTNSGGTGSYSFAATLTNVPICWARSNTSIADELSVTVTTSSITVTTTGATSTWVYGCTLRN